MDTILPLVLGIITAGLGVYMCVTATSACSTATITPPRPRRSGPGSRE